MRGYQGVESIVNHAGLSDEEVLNLFARTAAVC